MKVCQVESKRVRAGRMMLSLLFFLLISAACCPAAQKTLEVLPAPVINSEYYPCSGCHGAEQNGKASPMQPPHPSVSVQGHTENGYDCYDCHARGDMDHLALFNGRRLDLVYSSALCGQCHSTNYTLWQTGLHGKLIGTWKGERKTMACTACHDPHRPAFPALHPEPPPVPPEKTLWWRR